MVEWSKKWSLNLNASKCKVLHIARWSNPIEHAYYLNGDLELEHVSSEKDLGVHIDNQLSFQTHVPESVKKTNRNTGIIYRNVKFIGEDVYINM